MYDYIKERGYAIYPGKVTEAATFRIGNIGEIYKEDVEKLCGIMSRVFGGEIIWTEKLKQSSLTGQELL